MSAEEGFVKVPCFAQMKIAQTLFKNEWTLTRTLLYVVCKVRLNTVITK